MHFCLDWVSPWLIFRKVIDVTLRPRQTYTQTQHNGSIRLCTKSESAFLLPFNLSIGKLCGNDSDEPIKVVNDVVVGMRNERNLSIKETHWKNKDKWKSHLNLIASGSKSPLQKVTMKVQWHRNSRNRGNIEVEPHSFPFNWNGPFVSFPLQSIADSVKIGIFADQTKGENTKSAFSEQSEQFLGFTKPNGHKCKCYNLVKFA